MGLYLSLLDEHGNNLRYTDRIKARVMLKHTLHHGHESLWHLDETDGSWKEMKKKSKTKDKHWNVKFNLGYNMLARSS